MRKLSLLFFAIILSNCVFAQEKLDTIIVRNDVPYHFTLDKGTFMYYNINFNAESDKIPASSLFELTGSSDLDLFAEKYICANLGSKIDYYYDNFRLSFAMVQFDKNKNLIYLKFRTENITLEMINEIGFDRFIDLEEHIRINYKNEIYIPENKIASTRGIVRMTPVKYFKRR